ncbi:MAG: DUF2313 domain-containing protein [Clostridiales bacterium]|nr:DUF2313 domain-containing protein [Clostridiales bacterium]
MGYFEYLKGTLEPLGIYDLESGVGAGELFAAGLELDKVFLELEELCREAIAATSRSYGIKNYEKILPYRPSYITIEDAQRAITSLLRIRGGSFTLDMLQSTVSGCGIRAEVYEGGTGMSAVVSFPENRGIPEDFDKLKRRIEEIMPCHLNLEYRFTYASWRELMEGLHDWRSIESKAPRWRDVETYF